MGWLALVITLLLEQVHAMPALNPVYSGAAVLADSAARNLNAGKARHGVYAWLLVVGGAMLVTGVAYALARSIHWLAGLTIDVLVLFFALGFRHFSHHVTLIQTALAQGDLHQARRELTAWKRSSEPDFDATDLDTAEIVRQSIEFGLLASQRHVFGVFFWFVLLPGPVGAVLYRLSDYVARSWNRPPTDGDASLPPDRFGAFAQRAFFWIDWLPARLAALGFAIVGDFEGALYCWRRVTHASAPEIPTSRALILGTASGALGVRIVSAAESAKFFDERGLEGAGLAEPDANALRSAVGLAWRALVLWLILLLLLTVVATFG